MKRVGHTLPFAFFCCYSASKGLNGGGCLGSMAWFLYAAAMLIVVAAIFAFPIASLIGDYMARHDPVGKLPMA